ncbi:MAG: diguanylate cyclase [Alphaproteobacteria bacterium]|nr:diguanylate cyclase [Alphaproteobacteria bacterium]
MAVTTRLADRFRTLGTKVKFWFFAVGAILLVVSGLIFQSVTQLISSSRWVEHTYQVIDTIDLTAARFVDAQSAERGYVATCSKVLLLPYRTDIPRIYSDIATLRALTADNPDQQKRLDRLHDAMSAELARMNLAVADAAGGKTKAADQLVADKTDRINAKRIFALTKEMGDEERRLLKQRVGSVNFFATSALIACVCALLASLVILTLVFWRIRRETKEREAAKTKLYETNERLQCSLADLQLRDNAGRSIALLGELLQTCRNTGEALSIAARHLQQLIPNIRGTIGLFSNSRDMIEASQAIGDGAGFAIEFAPDECWGLRRGRLHHSGGNEPLCAHLPEKGDPTFCLPMIAQGETIGAMSVSGPYSFTEIEQQTIQTIAEQLSLALANLRLQETLRHQSLRDPLTGLFNRRYLEDALVREVARMRRRNEPLSVVMIDIDHFKRFNDTHGHQGGDALLAEFGLLLSRHARDEDIPVRYGGEEFALIMPGASLEIAAERAERLRDAVKRLHVRLSGKALGLVTLSAGVAAYPIHGGSGLAVIGEADAALYRAKQNGRDRVECAGSSTSAQSEASDRQSA